MKKNLEVLVIGILCIFLSVDLALALTPEESLKKNFPAIPVDSVIPSNIPGLYEVIAGQQIFYYAPEAEAIVVGPIIKMGGRNLTQERYQVLEQKRLSEMAGKIKDIPLEKALKIGNGKNIVIEVTDPDCSFCRQAAKFFKGRTDVTKYIFFFPLVMHKDAEPKVRHILCAKDKAKAYEDAMSGKLDDMKLKVCDSSDVEALIKVHRETAAKIGVTGTPFFIINSQPVVGANIPQIEKLLGGNK
jgi:thiol:disulfide interchange protein DsbC